MRTGWANFRAENVSYLQITKLSSCIHSGFKGFYGISDCLKAPKMSNACDLMILATNNVTGKENNSSDPAGDQMGVILHPKNAVYSISIKSGL